MSKVKKLFDSILMSIFGLGVIVMTWTINCFNKIMIRYFEKNNIVPQTTLIKQTYLYSNCLDDSKQNYYKDKIKEIKENSLDISERVNNIENLNSCEIDSLCKDITSQLHQIKNIFLFKKVFTQSRAAYDVLNGTGIVKRRSLRLPANGFGE